MLDPPKPPESPPVTARRRGRRRGVRLRVALWRYRHALAAVALGLAVLVALGDLRPRPPALTTVVTLSGARAAGVTLRPADLTVTRLPADLVPAESLTDPAQATGARLAVGLPAGYPLAPTLVVGPGLADGAPPGTVVVPVRLSDPAVADLLRSGDRIDIHRAPGDGSGGAATVVARDALVLARTEVGSTGWLGTDEGPGPLLLVAVSPPAATLLTGAGEWSPLGVVLVPRARSVTPSPFP